MQANKNDNYVGQLKLMCVVSDDEYNFKIKQFSRNIPVFYFLKKKLNFHFTCLFNWIHLE